MICSVIRTNFVVQLKEKVRGISVYARTITDLSGGLVGEFSMEYKVSGDLSEEKHVTYLYLSAATHASPSQPSEGIRRCLPQDFAD